MKTLRFTLFNGSLDTSPKLVDESVPLPVVGLPDFEFDKTIVQWKAWFVRIVIRLKIEIS